MKLCCKELLKQWCKEEEASATVPSYTAAPFRAVYDPSMCSAVSMCLPYLDATVLATVLAALSALYFATNVFLYSTLSLWRIIVRTHNTQFPMYFHIIFNVYLWFYHIYTLKCNMFKCFVLIIVIEAVIYVLNSNQTK